ncbi:MAG: glycosyltransferase family 2 protein [Bacteroidales bacterium]|nr:glycosyltransferase family 2 protein [Bacteroidales bacterium]
MSEILSIVIPAYNEENNINLIYQELKKELKEIEFKIIFVDDGSHDNTYNNIKELSGKYDNISGLSFSRNFGKEAAILAGLKESKTELVVVMDADLQHPPVVIPEMIRGIVEEGYDIVTTRRTSRKGEPYFRSLMSKRFYKLINRLSDTKIIDGAQDFRIMTRQVVDSVLELDEYHRFSKGIFSWVGYDVKYIEVDSYKRIEGKSSWSFWSLIKYAIEGVVSFSTRPLRFATIFGSIVSLLSFLYLIQVIIEVIILGKITPGYTSTIAVVLFLGGIQLLALGIIGEYISRTYMQVKKRPHYFIKKRCGK